MKITEIRDAVIPEIAAFCGKPIIMGDTIGDKPKGPHATYKITLPYGKGVGQAEETMEAASDGAYVKRIEEYRSTFSFTAYAMDEDDSIELAQQIHDWFAFEGYAFLEGMGVVIADQTDVTNRDAFIVDDYERRNGFDVILKVMRTRKMEVDWFDKVQANGETISGQK